MRCSLGRSSTPARRVFATSNISRASYPVSDKVELGGLSAKEMFSSGKAGMYVCGGWRVLGFRDITDFGWDIAPIPLSPNSGKRGTVVDTVSWSIAKDTEYRDAAWELVKFSHFVVGKT